GCSAEHPPSRALYRGRSCGARDHQPSPTRRVLQTRRLGVPPVSGWSDRPTFAKAGIVGCVHTTRGLRGPLRASERVVSRGDRAHAARGVGGFVVDGTDTPDARVTAPRVVPGFDPFRTPRARAACVAGSRRTTRP